jgi:LytS/YehU family sensor histidine kinase
VVWAAWHKRRDAWPSVVGIVVSAILLVVQAEDFRTSFFLKFLPAMLGLMASLALYLHDQRRRAQAAQLAAARLELEMLKKNIQPHFLLNTLATIMETIEEEPKTAAALVESLAGEFRILSRVAGEKLIPLAQELELCRAHLRVMSLRKGVTCSLIHGPIDERALVPPALFHTLIENGLTHLTPCNGRQDFELHAEPHEGGRRYTLLARGEREACLASAALGDRSSPAPEGPTTSAPVLEGTGLRYIKARLEESFTGRWTLESSPVEEGWKTVVDMGTADGAPASPAAIGSTSWLARGAEKTA